MPYCGQANSHLIPTGLTHPAEKTKVLICKAQVWHPAQVHIIIHMGAGDAILGNKSVMKEEGMAIRTNLGGRCGGLPYSGIWFNGIKIQIQQACSLLEGPRGIKLGSSEEEKQYEH